VVRRTRRRRRWREAPGLQGEGGVEGGRGAGWRIRGQSRSGRAREGGGEGPAEGLPYVANSKALSTIAEVETREAFEAWVESEDSREWIPKSFERFPEDDSALAGDYKLCSVELPWRAFLAGVDWREAR
jgi:hypothetical protein